VISGISEILIKDFLKKRDEEIFIFFLIKSPGDVTIEAVIPDSRQRLDQPI